MAGFYVFFCVFLDLVRYFMFILFIFLFFVFIIIIYLFLVLVTYFPVFLCTSIKRKTLLKRHDSDTTGEPYKVMAATITLRNKRGIRNGDRVTQYL